ncbi:MAG: hypothetical protein JNL97_14235 [Verrucomicrobiales bacterium]|nr:hypothetical protein [Verrucomicrobiales bacterium]
MSPTENAGSQGPNNVHIWAPPGDPPEDYPLTEPRDPPLSVEGGPVVFPKSDGDDPVDCDFQEFVWDVVNAISRVNMGLHAFKKGMAMGLSPDEAKRTYDLAVRNYQDLYDKWRVEMTDKNTWIQPALSTDGYVTEVVVRSRAFAIHTPGQSESRNSTNPPRKA